MTYRILKTTAAALTLTCLAGTSALANGPTDFATLDANSDRQVTFKEYATVAKRDFGMTTTAAAQMFTKISGDAILTEDELWTGMAQMDSDPFAAPRMVEEIVEVPATPTPVTSTTISQPMQGVIVDDTTTLTAPDANTGLIVEESMPSVAPIPSAPVMDMPTTNIPATDMATQPDLQGTLPGTLSGTPEPTIADIPDVVTEKAMDAAPDIKKEMETDLGTSSDSEVSDETPDPNQTWD